MATNMWCVVPAAGRGARMGSAVPKQYLPLAGRPVIAQTLDRLTAHPQIAGVMVALAADDGHWKQLTEDFSKPVLTTHGGADRAASVLAGLQALPDEVADTDFVLIHDAARPCVRATDISRLIELAVPAGGGLLGAPLRDTLKCSDAGSRCTATESREDRWRAFTPQMFCRSELARALIDARTADVAVTDEAMAMERVGAKPLLVEGAEDNIKITTAGDLALAEFLLGKTC